MQSSPRRSPNEKQFTRRRSIDAGLALADAAHVATWRLYGEVLRLWRACGIKKCRRHRRCLGEPAACLLRGLSFVTPAQRLEAAKAVIAVAHAALRRRRSSNGRCAANRCRR